MARETEDSVFLKCPQCHQDTDSIKQFTIARFVLFLLLYFSWRSIHYTACPSCTRKYILGRMALNLVPANLTWPIFVVVSWGPQFARTFSRGHTRWIRKQIAAGKLAPDSTFA